MSTSPAHVACIIGGAVAGSEAASQFGLRGIRSVVIDMGPTPWGKIELGLPKWHAKQRDQEEAGIDQKIGHPLVTFVPSTKVGTDVQFSELQEIGFSVILLAVGAWQDRPLPIPGIDDYLNSGFYYQNPFVAWFNQYHDPNYDGPQFEIADGTAVIGGGLASLDVVKIVMLELTKRALAERGIEADLFELEKKGIPKTLERLGVRWEDLGLQGCTLYYRRRAIDMPLTPVEGDETPDKLLQAQKVREKLLENFTRKYMFKFQPCRIPVDKIVKGGKVAGLIFRETRVEGGRVEELPGTDHSVPTPLVISSIGSIPEPLPGVKMQRELFKISEPETGKLEGYENVFALGNAVTGRGNIRSSRLHGRHVAEWIMEHHLEWSEADFQHLRGLQAEAKNEKIAEFVRQKGLKDNDELDRIYGQVAALQKRVGYNGDYCRWLERLAPTRLENVD